eukprot:m51a1_g3984 putative serine-threonine protein (1351) ;mRNA; r:464591-469876
MSATVDRVPELEARVRELECALEEQKARVRALEAELASVAHPAAVWSPDAESAGLAHGDTDDRALESAGLVVSKRSLAFMREPHQPCPVETPIEDTVVLRNTTTHQVRFSVWVPDGGHAFTCTASPGRGTIKPRSEVSVRVRLVLHYTAHVEKRAAKVAFWPRRGLIRARYDEEPIGYAHLLMAADGAVSPYIDPDEVSVEDTPLGSGSNCSVFRATYRGLPVAVKIPKNQQTFTPEQVQQFRDESELLRQLRAREIVNFCGASIVPGHLCSCFELMEQGTLEALLRNPVQFELQLRFAHNIATALAYLHSNNIIHRGVDPSNIYIVSTNCETPITCKLGGFVSARNVDKIREPFAYPAPPHDVTDVHYLGPEAIEEKPYNHKIDVFAFGVTLWQTFTTEMPWHDVPLNEIGPHVVKGERPAIPEGCPEAYAALISGCWAQDYAARPEFTDVPVTDAAAASSAASDVAAVGVRNNTFVRGSAPPAKQSPYEHAPGHEPGDAGDKEARDHRAAAVRALGSVDARWRIDAALVSTSSKLVFGENSRIFKGALSLGAPAVPRERKSGDAPAAMASAAATGEEVQVALKFLEDPSAAVTEATTFASLVGVAYVAKFHGLCMMEAGLAVVTELYEGDILSILRNRKPPPLRQMVSFVRQVARGLNNLAERRVVHCDLAARNVLVFKAADGNLVPKISDFAKAVVIAASRSSAQVPEATKLPVAWIAPEVLKTREVDKHSDVWSYGVFLFEMFSGGANPYGYMSHEQIAKFVSEGGRLSFRYLKTSSGRVINKQLYNMMERCWNADPAKRPEFLELERELGQMEKGVVLMRPETPENSGVSPSPSPGAPEQGQICGGCERVMTKSFPCPSCSQQICLLCLEKEKSFIHFRMTLTPEAVLRRGPLKVPDKCDFQLIGKKFDGTNIFECLVCQGSISPIDLCCSGDRCTNSLCLRCAYFLTTCSFWCSCSISTSYPASQVWWSPEPDNWFDRDLQQVKLGVNLSITVGSKWVCFGCNAKSMGESRTYFTVTDKKTYGHYQLCIGCVCKGGIRSLDVAAKNEKILHKQSPPGPILEFENALHFSGTVSTSMLLASMETGHSKDRLHPIMRRILQCSQWPLHTALKLIRVAKHESDRHTASAIVWQKQHEALVDITLGMLDAVEHDPMMQNPFFLEKPASFNSSPCQPERMITLAFESENTSIVAHKVFQKALEAQWRGEYLPSAEGKGSFLQNAVLKRSPRAIFGIHAFFYALFLVLVIACGLTPTSTKFTGQEIALYIWVIGLLVGELVELRDSKVYFRSGWNILDAALIGSYCAAFVAKNTMRLKPPSRSILAYDFFFGIGSLTAILRALFWVLPNW